MSRAARALRPPSPARTCTGRHSAAASLILAALWGALAALVPLAAQEAPARLSVRVESDSGEPVRRATVHLVDAVAREAVRLSETAPGLYRTGIFRSGLFRLEVRALGYAEASRYLRLDAGRDSSLAIRLARRPLRLAELVAQARVELRLPPAHAVTEIGFGDPAARMASLGELVARVEGVTVRRYGPGGRELVSVRGSRPEGVLVLLDGVPINDPLTGAADLSLIPTHGLESVRVVRGGSSWFGAGGLAGVILLRSRAASGDAIAASAQIGSFGKLGGQAFFSTQSRTGSIGLAAEMRSIRNDFTYRDRTHPDEPSRSRRNADSRRASLSLVAAAAELPLSVRMRLGMSERGIPGRMGTTLFDRARWEERDLHLSGRLGDGAGATLTLGAVRRDQRYRDPRAGLEERQELETLHLDAGLPFGDGGAWLLRARGLREAARGSATAGSPARLTGGFSLSRRLRAGAAECSGTVAVDLTGSRAVVSPELTFEVRPSAGWRAWLRGSQGVRVPTFGDVHYASTYAVRANPGLEPERAVLDLELGVKRRLHGELPGLQATLFHRRTEDPIVWLAGSTSVWSPRNLGHLTAWGGELRLDWRPDPVWRLEATGAYHRSRVGFGRNRNPLPYQPAWSGALTVARRFADAYLEARLEYIDTRTTTLAATHELPEVTLLDLRAGHLLGIGGAKVRIDVVLDNVLDQRHEWIELIPEPGRQLELRLGLEGGAGR